MKPGYQLIRIHVHLQPIATQLEEISDKAQGMNIGTGLKEYFEREIVKILPESIGYQFTFNMSGHTEHMFYEKENPKNVWVI